MVQTDPTPAEVAAMISAFGTDKRMNILAALAYEEEPLSAGAIEDELCRGKISLDLNILAKRGLIEGERQGKSRLYTITKAGCEWLHAIAKLVGWTGVANQTETRIKALKKPAKKK